MITKQTILAELEKESVYVTDNFKGISHEDFELVADRILTLIRPPKRKLTHEDKIKVIRCIIEDWGPFDISDVRAESSPVVEAMGRLSHQIEGFGAKSVEVAIYDPNSHDSEPIDQYFLKYKYLSPEVIDEILELAEIWETLNI
jgi:hypothetical protein